MIWTSLTRFSCSGDIADQSFIALTFMTCRDLLMEDLTFATLEQGRQRWLEAAPDLSLTGETEMAN